MILAYGFLCLLLICNLLQAKSMRVEVVPRHIRQHIAGVTYESLQDIFQSYPVDRRNTDQPHKLFGTCDGLSGHRETNHNTSPFQNGTPDLVSKPCYSFLRNCQLDESMNEHVSFCVSSSPHRRYDYMVVTNDKRYQYLLNQKELCRSSKFEYYFKYAVYYPCVCDCESSEREVDRYFSLLDVVSDDDKVVTGVRFHKFDHVFYIQIQQVELGWNKIIRGQAEWKEIRRVSRSYLLSRNVSEYYKQEGNDDDLLKFHKNDFVYAVTSEQNTVLLDDLEGGPNEVLTGLRFRQVGKDLRLEIRVTPFHDETGTLETNDSRWVYNDIDKSKRKELKLQTPKIVPGESDHAMNILSRSNQFVKFQVSDFKTDLGQTTVPFITITDVDMDSPKILSGAGIFYRGNSDSAGFIALKMLLNPSRQSLDCKLT